MSDTHTHHQMPGGITIRRLDDADAEALMHLAALDSATLAGGHATERGEWLGVEVEGRLLAAASLDGERTLADPFSRTDELRALLELRVAQLRGREPRGNVRRLPRRARAGRTTTLAGSPPGAGGRLLTLRPY